MQEGTNRRANKNCRIQSKKKFSVLFGRRAKSYFKKVAHLTVDFEMQLKKQFGSIVKVCCEN